MCLASVKAAIPAPVEVIVVADGDTDGSWRVAEEAGVQVIRVPTARGPAHARNLGAQQAQGDILFFIDADVTIPENIVAHIAEFFQDHPKIAAIFGSYDDEPFQANFLSQYKNLMHYYVHQTGQEDASTFWAGCGAMRRHVFQEFDGFNDNYRRPCIEDVELGYRLKKAGYRIRLVKDLQVKHLKRWTPFSLLKTDIFYRALPWTALILKEDRFINDLNLKISGRLSVVGVFLLILCLIGSCYTLWSVLPALILFAGLFGLNRDLYQFFYKKHGLWFMIKAIPWHWAYFLYSGAAFAAGWFRQKLYTLRQRFSL
jgi:glycosyltransferase involved in cell wall biosynthesis